MGRRRGRRDSDSSSEEEEEDSSSSSSSSESSSDSDSGSSSTDSYSSSASDDSEDSESEPESESDNDIRRKKKKSGGRSTSTSGWQSDDSQGTEKKKEAWERVTKQICKSLAEENVPLISLIVQELGDDGKSALKMLQKTKKIERGKGIKTADGERRKSPGGVFLHLSKESLGIEKFKQLCKEANKMKTHQKELATAIKNKKKKKK